MTIDVRISDDIAAAMMDWRHDLHRFPELGRQEARTSGKVAGVLKSLGMEVWTGLAGTGVVGSLRGRYGRGGAIGLRAEMDALPIEERAELPFRSQTPGIFHACGHDGHMAILLGAATALARDPDFKGTVHFIFQPAEEALNGAQEMIDAGLFEQFPCDEIYALHNAPTLGVGNVAVRTGAILAACDDFTIFVLGKGAHAALPHFGADPIVAAAQLVTSLQTVVSRSLDPTESGVLTIGMISGGNSANVIPEHVVLRGTARAASSVARETICRRIREICAGVAAAQGVSIDFTIDMGCPPTVNAEAPTAALVRAARAAGAQVITDMPILMGSEDFATMLQARPGCYFLLGQGGEMIHHPAYAFDDSILPLGAAIFVNIVRDRLGVERKAPNIAETHIRIA
ncbi:hippurate hydrolase [Rhodoblastus acidophilus]|uniref:amidohydrolase n=1 Tax=Rhodoblastus acidophilus TaxID=1074 RepID=UPI002225304E|nr:amidohydrolase [Rhodoblastus acidophilus]MCW2286213.1 hippurate hydrolase [Rhodoblastus acidophilus]MCW2335105.1 hippurate hydrolase [Rhodoblastus acidophilus]